MEGDIVSNGKSEIFQGKIHQVAVACPWWHFRSGMGPTPRFPNDEYD